MVQTAASGTPINPRIGQRVMQARREQGLTQRELATQAGTGLAVITRLETGKQSVSAERLAAIARVLRVSLDFLCSEENTIVKAKARGGR
jgi:transcriptional regulator with XRE-family HTH domain